MKQFLYFSIVLFVLTSCGEPVVNRKDTANKNDSIVDKEPIDSLAYFSKNIKQNGQVARNWVNRSDYFLCLGNTSDALVDIKAAVQLDTTNVLNRTKLANLYLKTLDLNGAFTNYNYVLSRDSSSVQAYVGLGKVYAYLDNPGMATGYLNKAYGIDKHNAEAYFLEGLIYRGDYYKTGREESWERALSSYRTATVQNPKYFSAYIQMGVMHDEKGNDIALDYYNAALNVKPNNTEAWYNKGMYFQTRQKYEVANECYRKINEIDSMYANAYHNQGYIKMLVDKDLDSALYFFNKTIEVDSFHFGAYNHLGLTYEDKGDLVKALKFYEKAVEINPEFKVAIKNVKRLK